MPATYRIDVSARTVFSTSWGVFTDADLLDHAKRLQVDPSFNSGFKQLWDLTGVTSFQVTKQLLRERASAGLFDPGVQRAFVAPEDLAFAMTRLFEAYNDRQQIGVFRTMEAAWEWLWGE